MMALVVVVHPHGYAAGLTRLHWRAGAGACALALAAGRMVRVEWPAMGEVPGQHLGGAGVDPGVLGN